jgi:hypothetical protein
MSVFSNLMGPMMYPLLLIICFFLMVAIFLAKSILSPKKFQVGRGIALTKRSLKILSDLGQDPTKMSPDQWKAIDLLENHSKRPWALQVLYMLGTLFFVIGALNGFLGIFAFITAGSVLYVAQEYQRNIFEEQFRAASAVSHIPLRAQPAKPQAVRWFGMFLILVGLWSGFQIYGLVKTWGNPPGGVETFTKQSGVDQFPLPAEAWSKSPEGQRLLTTFYRINSGYAGHLYVMVSALLGLSALPLGLMLLRKVSGVRELAILFGQTKIALNLVTVVPSMIMLISMVQYATRTAAIPLWATAAYGTGLPLIILCQFLVSNLLYFALAIRLNRRDMKQLLDRDSLPLTSSVVS